MAATRPLSALLFTLAISGCSDSGFTLTRVESVAVTVGDFDNVQEPFNRMEVDTVRYDGIISTATWVEDEDDYTPPGLNVEGLFLTDDNQLRDHQAVFVASGTRGFGERQYNSLQPDNQIISDEIAVENATAFARGQGILFVTDWAYDLVVRTYPDKIDFLGDEAQLDAAQRGEIGRVRAEVVDPRLAEALQSEEISITYDFSNWAVIESVVDPDDVTVHLRGDVTYRDAAGGGNRTINGAPLLVTIDTGSDFGGKVVFSTFHLDAQNDAVIDTMLQTIVAEFDLTTVVRDPGEVDP